MKRIILLVLVTTTAFLSCNKNDNPPSHESVLDYYPLDVGNYWVYETSLCDSTWLDCDFKSTDTNFISKDTIINGIKYYKVDGKKLMGESPYYLRDSLDYIVDSDGKIRFSNKDFELVFNEEYIIQNNDTIFHWYNKMIQEPLIVSVPLGDIICLDNRLSFFRKDENFKHEFNSHNAYSKNIGLVYENSMFAIYTGGFQRELTSYKLVTTQ